MLHQPTILKMKRIKERTAIIITTAQNPKEMNAPTADRKPKMESPMLEITTNANMMNSISKRFPAVLSMYRLLLDFFGAFFMILPPKIA